ncbi:flavin reductase [Sphingopyxis sp. MWB1]|uniref:flavin reductase n=1 Tax=Sphingopyxis sp. MWB1 TaxID=1537715 RepID=UPI00051A041A|nr:flavin reductase [Sphingopyxis sp. MWB1]
MTDFHFKGFGGARLLAEQWGDENDPPVLLVPDAGEGRASWRDVAEALVLSGRRVIGIDLRQSRTPWNAETLSVHVEDLRAVLAQMGSRPAVVAARGAGRIAARALSPDGAHLAAGLILVDMPEDGALLSDKVAPQLSVPTLVMRGGLAPAECSDASDALVAALPVGECAQIDEADVDHASDRREALLGQLLSFLERHQPREAMEFKAGSDPRTLRDAMGCFATGITIVTALDDSGTPAGLTANSFTSVSLDPPLLLVCIANSAGTAPLLRAADHFGVNVLQIGQQPASNRFATKGEDRFSGLPWAPGETGVPLLGGSLVSFECQREAVHEAGDHFILVGRVVRAQFEPHRDPLLYFRGKYRRLHFA